MSNSSKEDASLTNAILQLTRSKKPQTVQQLVSLAQEETSLPESKIIEHITQLQSQGKIRLKQLPAPPTQKLSIYLRSSRVSWYWTTLILAAATTIAVFTIPENTSPIAYIRYILGTLFVLWLPGYSFIKTLFPTDPPFKTSSKNLDTLERLALSIGMSLALVPIISLLLNYTPWGVRLTPITLSLLALTTIFATAGVIREHKSQLEERTES